MTSDRSKFVSTRTAALAAGLLLISVQPLSAEDLDGAALYASKTCIACHGKDAKTPILPEYPKLAGQSEAVRRKLLFDSIGANGQVRQDSRINLDLAVRS